MLYGIWAKNKLRMLEQAGINLLFLHRTSCIDEGGEQVELEVLENTRSIFFLWGSDDWDSTLFLKCSSIILKKAYSFRGVIFFIMLLIYIRHQRKHVIKFCLRNFIIKDLACNLVCTITNSQQNCSCSIRKNKKQSQPLTPFFCLVVLSLRVSISNSCVSVKVVVTNQKNGVLHLDDVICQKFPLRFEERLELCFCKTAFAAPGASLDSAETAVKIELTQF